MNIAATGAQMPIMQSREAGEGPGPDKVNDHDADDGAAATAPASSAKAPTAPGVGLLVDKVA